LKSGNSSQNGEKSFYQIYKADSSGEQASSFLVVVDIVCLFLVCFKGKSPFILFFRLVYFFEGEKMFCKNPKASW
jgi:hypothetical protein